MARFLVATILLVVSLSYASAVSEPWYRKGECYCRENGYGEEYGEEMWERRCTEEWCDKGYEEQMRPCLCKEEPVLAPGEIAGIVVGGVVFLILIIIIIIWCVYCGCECDGGRGMRRYRSDDSIYRGKVIQAPIQQQMLPTVVAGHHIHAPQVVQAQQFQPANVTYAVQAPKPVTFAQSVVQTGHPQALTYVQM